MAQEGSGPHGGAAQAQSPEWLTGLKAKAALIRQRRERPPGKAFGRWLGDFLDQDTASGLLPAEEKLLYAAASGKPCLLQGRAARVWAIFDSWRKTVPGIVLPEDEGFAEAMTKFLQTSPD